MITDDIQEQHRIVPILDYIEVEDKLTNYATNDEFMLINDELNPYELREIIDKNENVYAVVHRVMQVDDKYRLFYCLIDKNFRKLTNWFNLKVDL